MSAIDGYAAGFRERSRASARANELRCEVLRDRAVVIARALAGELGARRVVLFGSVARGDAGLASDIDLLVSGVARDRILTATSRALLLAGDASVNLVDEREAAPWVLEAAARGLVLV